MGEGFEILVSVLAATAGEFGGSSEVETWVQEAVDVGHAICQECAERHVSPMFAGATVFAWSEVLAKSELPGRDDVGALRIRTVATKDRPCADFPYTDADNRYDPAVILDTEEWWVERRLLAVGGVEESLDERRQRALCRYYIAAGAGVAEGARMAVSVE